MQHLTLPSGATADLRGVEDVTERQRRPIKRLQAQLTAIPAFATAVKEANAAERTSGGELSEDAQMAIAAGMGSAFDPLEELNDWLVVALVRGWSYDLPVTVDSIQDLPSRDVDALRSACSPYLFKLMPNFEPSPDPASPIEPSTA